MLEKFILSFDDFKKNKNISIKNKAFNFDIDNNIIKSSDIKFSFNAVKYDDIVSVQYNINGYFLLECSRCLEQFKYDVNISSRQRLSSPLSASRWVWLVFYSFSLQARCSLLYCRLAPAGPVPTF